MPTNLDYMDEMGGFGQGGGLSYNPTGDFEGYARGGLRSLLALKLMKQDQEERERRAKEAYDLQRDQMGMTYMQNDPEYQLGQIRSGLGEGATPDRVSELFMKQWRPQPKDPSQVDQLQTEIDYYIKLGLSKDDAVKAAKGGGSYSPYSYRAGMTQSKNPMWDDLYAQVEAGTLPLDEAIRLYQQGNSKVNPNQPVNDAKALYSQATLRIQKEMQDLDTQYNELFTKYGEDQTKWPDDANRIAVSLQHRAKMVEELLTQIQMMQKDSTIGGKPVDAGVQKKLFDLGWGDWSNWSETPSLAGEAAEYDTSIPGPNGGKMVQGVGKDGQPVWVEIDIPQGKKPPVKNVK